MVEILKSDLAVLFIITFFAGLVFVALWSVSTYKVIIYLMYDIIKGWDRNYLNTYYNVSTVGNMFIAGSMAYFLFDESKHESFGSVLAVYMYIFKKYSDRGYVFWLISAIAIPAVFIVGAVATAIKQFSF